MPELHTLQTADDCLLDAAYWPAERAATGIADACVFTHGATGNAISAFQRAFAEALAAQGIATLSINTRGHDVVSRLAHANALPTRAGTAYEDVGDAVLDLHAGAAFLRDRGARRIAIGGHSLGAVKSIYVQSVRPIADASCVLAISPPRIAYAVQDTGEFAAPFRALLARARAAIEAGRPEELIDAAVPIPSLFTAAQYARKYGPESPFDIATHLPRLTVPAFVLYGRAELTQMQQMQASADAVGAMQGDLHVAFVDGADHSYTGRVDRATAQAVAWLCTAGARRG